MLQRERKEHRNDKGHKEWLKEKEENTEKQSKQRARIAVSEEERRKDMVLEREARDNQVQIQEEINKIKEANNSI